MKSNNNSSSRLGFFSVLQLIFIVLKLCGIINWSWIWVLSPIWIGTILGAILVILYIWANS